jgi:quercetin dioxygenase-like cupin family protein
MRMTVKLLLTALAVTGIATVAQAQPAPAAAPAPPAAAAPAAPPANTHSRPPVPFRFLTKAQIAQLMYRPGNTQSTVVTDHENYDIEYVTRALITDHVENHVHWLDFVTVLEGEGTLEIGGVPTDPNYRNPSEPSATKQTGATVYNLHPGDYLVVPAGVWHSFSGTAEHTLTYVIFKQRE